MIAYHADIKGSLRPDRHIRLLNPHLAQEDKRFWNELWRFMGGLLCQLNSLLVV
jgi:hypothetical protein